MLRAVAHHAKQALLAPGKTREHTPTLPVPLHTSCLSRSHALALAPPKHLSPRLSQGTFSAHIYPLSLSHTPPPVPCTPNSVASPAHFPSGIIDTIDAHSLATKDQRKSLVSHISASFNLRRYFRRRDSASRLAQFLASTSRPSRAHSVMVLAHALGCRFKPNHFESVAYQLSLKEHWSFIPPLVSLARHQCGKTTARLLNWKIRALIECHLFRPLAHVIGEFAQDNVQPTRRTFHLLVSGHLRNQDLNSAKRYLQLMENAGFPVDASTHALVATAYRSLGLDRQVHARALDALHRVDGKTSTRVLNSIIQHFLDIGDECGAAEHINRMVAPTTYRGEGETARHQQGTTTDAVGAPSLCTDPSPSIGKTHTILPDATTFTILINFLTTQRQFHRIHNVLNRMVEMGVEPDAGVVAALIRTCCLSGRDSVAMSLLAAMLRSDVDARGLFSLLRMKSEPQLPIDVKGIDLTVHVLNAALPRIMEIRGLSGAKFIIHIMQSRGIQSNAATIEAFLKYLDCMGYMETRHLTRVLRSISRNVQGPTIRHLNIILRNALRREKHVAHGTGWDTTAAKFSPTRRYAFAFPETRSILTSEDFDPSGHRYDPLDHSSIRSTILALSHKGIKNDRATFAMWLKHEGTADPTLENAKSVFCHMVDKGMHPNRYHFISLMDGFARVGDMQAAEQVMQSAKAASFEPDVVMWTVLISGYGRKGKAALAMKAFRTMVDAGIAPDVPAIDALAHAYFAVGAYSVARRVLLELWPRVKPFPSELKDAPLKQLARIFRQLGDTEAVRRKSLTVQEQRSFNRELRQVLKEWKEM